MTVEAGGTPVNATQLSELRSNLGIIDIVAGGNTASSVGGSAIIFSNSNGLSFGLDSPGGSVLTASYTVPEVSAFLTTAALSNHSHGNPTLALTGLTGTTASASNGLTLSLSAAAQSVQTQNSVQVQGSSGSIVFSNSNGITFGGNANTITASHNGLTTAALSNHSHGNPTLALTNVSGSTASASNGLTISLSVADPSAGGGVAAAAGTQTGSTGTINFANSNGMTFGMSNSSQITASYSVPSVAGLLSAVKISAGASSSNLSALTFSNANGVSFGYDGTNITASVAAVAGAQTGISGISGGTTQMTSGTAVFADSNGISFGVNGNTITATVKTDYLTTAALSNHSHGNPTLALTNLTGTTASASNGLTLSLSAANAVAQTNQSMGIYGSSQTYGQSSSSTVDARSISIVGSGGVSVGMSAGSVLISGQSTNGLISAINVSGGTTSQNLSKLTFADGNGVSFGLNGSVLTASVAAVAGAQTGISGIANSQTTFTSGTVSFSELGAITIRSTTGNQLQFSVNAQTVQTQSLIAALYDGANSISTGTVRFSNSNGVSFGINGQTITASHNGITSQTVQTQSNVQGISAGTQVGRTGDIVFSNSNGISFGLSGSNTLTASYTVPGATVFSNSNNVSFGLNGSTVTATATFAQTNQAIGIYASSQTYGQSSSSTFDARSLSVVGSGGVSVGMSAGSLLISGQTTAAQTAQSIGIYGSSQTYGQSSSSTIDARSLSIVGSGGVSVGMSAGSLLISGQTTLAQSAQTQSNVQGIIVSDTTYRTGDVSFKNANGISFGSSGANIVTASYSVPSVAGLLSAINLSAGTTSNNLSAMVFSNSNGITFGLNGSTVTAQHNAITTARASTDAIGLNTAQTNVTWTVNSSGLSFNAAGYAGTGTSITGNAAITLDSNGFKFNGSSLAGVSTGFTGANISASLTHNSAGLAMSMSVAPPGAATLTAYAVSNTTQGTSGTIPGSVLSFHADGGLSVGISNGSVVISGPALSSISVTGALSASSNGATISLGVGTVTWNAASNTTNASTGTVDLGNLTVKGAGGVSAGISNGSLVISGGAGAGMGISAGTQSVSTGTLVFSNSNGITFGMSGSSQVTASYNSTQFAGLGTTFQGNNVSGSMTLNSAGLNLSVSVAAPGAAAENNNHILLGANTAGNTTASGSTIGLSGLNLTLSGTNASQIVISAPATSSLVGVSGILISTNGSTVSVYNAVASSRFIFEPPGASSAGSAMTQGSMSFQRVFIPENISISRVDVPCMISLASSAAANTGVLLISSGLVVYSVSGTSTLNPIVGAFGTTTYSHASNTANFNSITGPRYLSFPIGTILTAGEYYIGVQLSTNNNSSIGTATTALAATISIQHGAIYTASQWQEFGAVTATSINMRPFVGVAASVTATGQTQQLSNITQTGTALARANIPVIFRNF